MQGVVDALRDVLLCLPCDGGMNSNYILEIFASMCAVDVDIVQKCRLQLFFQRCEFSRFFIEDEDELSYLYMFSKRNCLELHGRIHTTLVRPSEGHSYAKRGRSVRFCCYTGCRREDGTSVLETAPIKLP